MMRLIDGMLLYHGSYAEVSCIDLGRCKQGKDFGRGFYVTSSYEQAQNFVPLSVNKQIKEGGAAEDTAYGCISTFRLHLDPEIQVHLFDSADREWLHYVASNRREDLFAEVRDRYRGYDIIGGKIANDRTAATLQLYITGGYGEPGSEQADNIAIATLLPNRLEDQFCFCDEKAVSALEFVRSERYDFRRI